MKMGSASVQQKAAPHQQNLSSDEKIIKIIPHQTNWPQEKDHFFCKLGKISFWIWDSYYKIA